MWSQGLCGGAIVMLYAKVKAMELALHPELQVNYKGCSAVFKMGGYKLSSKNALLKVFNSFLTLHPMVVIAAQPLCKPGGSGKPCSLTFDAHPRIDYHI